MSAKALPFDYEALNELFNTVMAEVPPDTVEEWQEPGLRHLEKRPRVDPFFIGNWTLRTAIGYVSLPITFVTERFIEKGAHGFAELWRTFCPFCGRTHVHSPEPGLKQANCPCGKAYAVMDAGCQPVKSPRIRRHG